MRYEIKIPQSLKFGGFDYSIDLSQGKQLQGRSRYGECVGFTKEIRIDPDQLPQQLSETFIHEILEAVDNVWCNANMRHEDITNISNGLHQVLEQLEVRFVKE